MAGQLAKLAEDAVNQMNPTRMQKLIKLGYLNNDGSNNWEFINAKLEELHPKDKKARNNMSDVELVIKISEELYYRFGREYREEGLISKYTNDAILEAFCNGTPLPKGHGRLKDVDALAEKAPEIQEYLDVLAPTIIEANKTESEEV